MSINVSGRAPRGGVWPVGTRRGSCGCPSWREETTRVGHACSALKLIRQGFRPVKGSSLPAQVLIFVQVAATDPSHMIGEWPGGNPGRVSPLWIYPFRPALAATPSSFGGGPRLPRRVVHASRHPGRRRTSPSALERVVNTDLPDGLDEIEQMSIGQLDDAIEIATATLDRLDAQHAKTTRRLAILHKVRARKGTEASAVANV